VDFIQKNKILTIKNNYTSQPDNRRTNSADLKNIYILYNSGDVYRNKKAFFVKIVLDLNAIY